ncbi:MAG: ABC transporter substrate-binding protein [Chloroflexi bacterium]|nr:ABC transporter substrate-binding protein [Chloroflexota bacterium]
MGYIPDPQYAPFYVAVDKGYYAEEGLEVTFDYSFETDGGGAGGGWGTARLPLSAAIRVILARAQSLPHCLRHGVVPALSHRHRQQSGVWH